MLRHPAQQNFCTPLLVVSENPVISTGWPQSTQGSLSFPLSIKKASHFTKKIRKAPSFRWGM
jgi:hypothetical protein